MKHAPLFMLYLWLVVGSIDVYKYLLYHNPIHAALAAFFLFGASKMSDLVRS